MRVESSNVDDRLRISAASLDLLRRGSCKTTEEREIENHMVQLAVWRRKGSDIDPRFPLQMSFSASYVYRYDSGTLRQGSC